MAGEIVFLTLFLGLISGRQHVAVQTGTSVAAVRLLLDDREVATLRGAPWAADVDFGAALKPAELTAVALDARGNELGRATQSVNLPRREAEFVIAVKNDSAGRPVGADLRWEHVMGRKPSHATFTVDGKAIPVDAKMHASLPRLSVEQPHVIAAEMRFDDGFVTRREQVIAGGVADTAEAELTPIAVTATSNGVPKDLDTCLTSNGAPVHVTALESSAPLVVFVRDLDLRVARAVLRPAFAQGNLWTNWPGVRQLVSLPEGWTMRVVWPIAERYKTTSNVAASLFPPTDDMSSSEGGLIWMLVNSYPSTGDTTKIDRRFADAVGVAGLNAMNGGRRRAVVLMLSRKDDHSTYDAQTIRSYLASIGVPLFVWSLYGPEPEARATWGEIEDVSSYNRLRLATERLEAKLASQRVAWVATGRVAALHVQPTGRCGIEPLAH